jgi:3-methyladenine DNA glycosylase AlkC
MSEQVAAADALVTLLGNVNPEALQKACVQLAETRSKESDALLRGLASEAVAIEFPNPKTLLEVFADESEPKPCVRDMRKTMWLESEYNEDEDHGEIQ